ncbi:MAG: thiamine pyrophosphate-binding protein [Alphaproteobacteria bacterium]|nr:thiamine pyrophosphate-binding protein [Alphaproteobacteria bacterium]
MSGDSTVAEALVDALRAVGVRYVFGVPSGGWVDYMEALRRADGIDFVLATHEGAAAVMADVCGRLGDAPGACFGTLGPGATNLATGIGGALLDRSPVIAFTDEIPAPLRGRTTQMGIDHQALFRPLTKKTTRLTPDGVRAQLFDAARLALEERPGPVHIGLPLGLSAAPAAPDDEGAFSPPPPPPAADAALLAQAADLFAQAERPILALGLGAVRAGARDRIQAFAHAHQVPVVLTPMAKGMFVEDDPAYAGVLFHALSDMVGETHRQADLILAIGYDPVEFNFESWLPPGVPVVSIDTVPADLDQAANTLAVDAVGDIGAAIDALAAVPAGPKGWKLGAMAQRRAEMFERLRPMGGGFGPKAALEVLREVLPADGIMTCDVGAHTHLIGQQWPTPEPGLQIMTNGWSAMGFGIPSAIAAKLMNPARRVCTVVGDGGFLMTAGEIATAQRCRLNTVIVLLTDNELALIRIKQEKKGDPVYGTPVRGAGTLGGDAVFGAPLLTARDGESFRDHLSAAFGMDGPVVVEAIVDPREYDDVVLRPDRP